MARVPSSQASRNTTLVRIGFDVGGRYVVPIVPIHLGAQLTYFDVAPTAGGERAYYGITFAAGLRIRLVLTGSRSTLST